MPRLPTPATPHCPHLALPCLSPCPAPQYKPRRAPQRSSNYKPLTQAELLAEAAKTEIENSKSLQVGRGQLLRKCARVCVCALEWGQD